jgi:hypothetical protein
LAVGEPAMPRANDGCIRQKRSTMVSAMRETPVLESLIALFHL